MKLDLYLDLFLTIVTLGCALPAWVQMILQGRNRQKLIMPVSLVTGSVLVAVLFENLITFGNLTLDYSLRFAAFGFPLSLLAIIFTRRQTVGSAALWVRLSSGSSMVVWFLLVTLH